MTNGTTNDVAPCAQTALTAAYLDGELGEAAADAFERHAKECRPCADALLEQRRLLCLLDAAFDETFSARVRLPKGFTRQVRARAQTDMSGVRCREERTRALKICAALAAAASALLGFALFDAVVAPAWRAARAGAGVLAAAGGAAAGAGAGAGLVVRAFGGRLMTGSEPFVVLRWLMLAAAVVLLLRLISRYHRAGARD
jgi:anti-sigma factor RsiW